MLDRRFRRISPGVVWKRRKTGGQQVGKEGTELRDSEQAEPTELDGR